MSLWIFVLAIALSTIISMVTISFQSIRLALANPAVASGKLVAKALSKESSKQNALAAAGWSMEMVIR